MVKKEIPLKLVLKATHVPAAEMLKHLFHLIEVILLNLHKEMFSSNVS